MSQRHMSLLPISLEPLYRCAAKDDIARFAMTGIHLETSGDSYTAVATDGRVLGVVAGTMPDEKEFPALPDLLAAPNSGTSGIIGTKDWRAGFKRIPGVSKRRPRHLAVVMGVSAPMEGPLTEKQDRPTVAAPLTLATASGERGEVTSHTLVDGRFPKWQEVFPKVQPVCTVRIHPEVLDKLLRITGEMHDAESGVVTEYCFPEEAKWIIYSWKGKQCSAKGEFACEFTADGKSQTVKFNPHNLQRVARLAADFMVMPVRRGWLNRTEQEERQQLLTLTFYGKSNHGSDYPVLITSEGSSFRGLVMTCP